MTAQVCNELSAATRRLDALTDLTALFKFYNTYQSLRCIVEEGQDTPLQNHLRYKKCWGPRSILCPVGHAGSEDVLQNWKSAVKSVKVSRKNKFFKNNP